MLKVFLNKNEEKRLYNYGGDSPCIRRCHVYKSRKCKHTLVLTPFIHLYIMLKCKNEVRVNIHFSLQNTNKQYFRSLFE